MLSRYFNYVREFWWWNFTIIYSTTSIEHIFTSRGFEWLWSSNKDSSIICYISLWIMKNFISKVLILILMINILMIANIIRENCSLEWCLFMISQIDEFFSWLLLHDLRIHFHFFVGSFTFKKSSSLFSPFTIRRNLLLQWLSNLVKISFLWITYLLVVWIRLVIEVILWVHYLDVKIKFENYKVWFINN